MDGKLYKKIFRIPTSRLRKWDYSSSGWYFVTICTKEKKEYLGSIFNKKIKLSKIGVNVEKYWLQIPKHYPFVNLDIYVIMPNHIHGILNINNTYIRRRDGACPVSTNSIKQNTLGNIIGSFKSAVKKYVTMNNINFFWQARYYDHIIRNEKSLNIIRRYVQDNPQNWENDEENKI